MVTSRTSPLLDGFIFELMSNPQYLCTQQWCDSRLRWDQPPRSALYGNISSELRVPSKSLWLPDIILENKWVQQLSHVQPTSCWLSNFSHALTRHFICSTQSLLDKLSITGLCSEYEGTDSNTDNLRFKWLLKRIWILRACCKEQ